MRKPTDIQLWGLFVAGVIALAAVVNWLMPNMFSDGAGGARTGVSCSEVYGSAFEHQVEGGTDLCVNAVNGRAQPYPGQGAGDTNGGTSGLTTGTADCESQVSDMEAQGTTSEDDHAYYVELCEQMN